jgi:hypothetical protein
VSATYFGEKPLGQKAALGKQAAMNRTIATEGKSKDVNTTTSFCLKPSSLALSPIGKGTRDIGDSVHQSHILRPQGMAEKNPENY